MVEGLFMVLVTTNDSNTRLKHAIVSLNSRACSYLPSMKAMGSWVGLMKLMGKLQSNNIHVAAHLF